MQVSVVEIPIAAPSQCYYCGGAQKEYFIDTGMSFDFYGAVYVCNQCFDYMAKEAKYFRTDEIEALKVEVISLNEEKAQLEKRLKELYKVVGILSDHDWIDDDSLISDLPSSGSPTGDDVSDVHEDVELLSETTPDGEGSLVEGETDAPESSDGEGSGESTSNGIPELSF